MWLSLFHSCLFSFFYPLFSAYCSFFYMSFFSPLTTSFFSPVPSSPLLPLVLGIYLSYFTLYLSYLFAALISHNLWLTHRLTCYPTIYKVLILSVNVLRLFTVISHVEMILSLYRKLGFLPLDAICSLAHVIQSTT